MGGYRGNAEMLFCNLRMFDVINNQEAQAVGSVDSIDANQILGTPAADIMDYLIKRYAIAPIELLRDEAAVDQKEKLIEVRDPFSDYGFGQYGGTRNVVGTCVELTIPFRGDRELLNVQPTTFNTNPPRACVYGQSIVIEVEGQQLDIATVRRQLDSILADIEKYLAWQRPNIDQFNAGLPEKLRANLERRRNKLLHDRRLVADLGFPMKKRDDATKTYAMPSVRRKIEPRLPPASTAPFKPEPTVDETTYADILKVMGNMTTMMERSPKAFAHMGEEQLRDHFLVQLNGRYEGNATGETFNYSGKTDILIKVDGRNVFVAECKFWKGEKSFVETIEQLLGYLSWRDTKTAVVIFNRNQNLSGVLLKVKEAMSAYPHKKRGPDVKQETVLRYVCNNPSDVNREVIVTVLVFDIPS